MVTQILFESPLYLGLLSFLVLIVLLGIWTRTRDPRALRTLFVGMLVTVLLFGIQHWVVTDRETLEHTIARLSTHVEAGDVPGIIALVDPNASLSGGHDRDDLAEVLTHLLKWYTVENIRLSGFEVSIQQTQATLRCRSHCMIVTREWSRGVPSEWEIHFRLDGQRWRITELRPVSIAQAADHLALGHLQVLTTPTTTGIVHRRLVARSIAAMRQC